MQAPQEDHMNHPIFTLLFPHDSFTIDKDKHIGLAWEGQGAFLRGYKHTHAAKFKGRSNFVTPLAMVVGFSDDVARDMVVGKELYMQEEDCDYCPGLGFETGNLIHRETLPTDTCTMEDQGVVGMYRPGSNFENPGESSDEEGRVWSRQRYRQMKCDVFVPKRGGEGVGGGGGGRGLESSEGESEEESDDEDDWRF